MPELAVGVGIGVAVALGILAPVRSQIREGQPP